MAAELADSPSTSCLQELVLSFPQEWRGLFAALNVKESQAVALGTKWLREKAFSPQKGHISPHWPSLITALNSPFPVVFNGDVLFWPKFSCLTLKIQRNLLCFIVVHSENIPVDDMEVFLTMLSRPPQANYPWMRSLTCVLQTKYHRMRLKRENYLKSLRPENEGISCDKAEQNDSVDSGLSECRALTLGLKKNPPDLSIFNEPLPQLEGLCSTLNQISFPGSTLLSSDVQHVINSSGDKMVISKFHLAQHSETCTPEKMDTDFVGNIESVEGFADNQEEVIEILDDSPIVSSVVLSELPNPPAAFRFSDMNEAECIEVDIEEPNLILEKVTEFKEHLRSTEDLEERHFSEFVKLFLESVSKHLEKICQFMEMENIPERATVMLIHQFLSLTDECSFQASVVFAQYCIGLKLGTLQQAASRNLAGAVTAFAKAKPKGFIDGVIVKMFDLKLVEWPQYDLILKIIKDTMEKDNVKYFLRKVLNFEKSTLVLSPWNDHVISIFSAVLDMKLDIDRDIFVNFVTALQNQSLSLAKNLKFAKLVLTTINKYGPMVKESYSVFQQILEENNTFLKKSALTALKKVVV